MKNSMIEKRLVRNNLKKNKFRNICAIIAIVLTSILFTSVFSVFFLLRDGFSEVEARKNGWTGHAVITGVTQKQFDSLKNNSLVEQISYYIHYGFILDKKKNLGVELRYDQKQMLDWNFFDIIEGKIPQKRNEILVSKDFFKRENIKYGINQKVELAYWINGSTYKQKFYISGIYSKCEVQKECVFISKELSNELSKKLKEQSDMNDSAAGLGAVEVKFQNTHHLQEDLANLIKQSTCDKQKNHYDINPIYESSDNSMKSEIIILCVLLVVVGFIGYLIIYNVFYISIRNDTRYYGLLRTLGFSKGEIKRLIRNEIYAISLIAIPLGVVLGYVISEVLLPKILALFQLSVKMNGFSIYIFIYSIVFSFITVSISCSKPAKVAVNMTAIEARKFSGDVVPFKHFRMKKPNTKIYTMAFKNLLRERKKAIRIIISFTLSLMLLSIVCMITAGMRIDKFVEDMICTDFIISDESFFSASNVDVPDMSKNQKQIEKLNQTNGVLDHGAAYKRTIDHRLSKKALMKFDRIMNQDIVESSPMSDQLKDMNLGIKPINLDLYGLDSYVIRLLEAREGTIDIRKFNKGGYVMVSGFVESDTGESCYKPGDKMTIQYPNGNKKEYTVMAIADLPDSLTAGGISMAGFQAFIPCSEWVSQIRDTGCYMYCYNIDEKYESTWEHMLEKYVTGGNVGFSYRSKKTYQDDFENLVYGNILLGGSLAVVIGIISIVNYINIIVTGIYSRKREFAVMQSIGMSKKQLYQMVRLEGAYYIGIAFAIVISVGSIINYAIMKRISDTVIFIEYNFTIIPVMIILPIGLILAFIVPTLSFYFMDKKEDMLKRLKRH